MIRRSWPLLFALILFSAAAAAPPSLETALRDAQAAIDAGKPADALRILDEALAKLPGDSEAAWQLRAQRVAPLIQLGMPDEARKVLDLPFPPALRNTAAEVRRLLALGFYQLNYKTRDAAATTVDKARVVAAAHAPHLMLDVLNFGAFLRDDPAMAEEAVRLARERGDLTRIIKTETTLFTAYTRNGRLAEAVKLAEAMAPRLESASANSRSKYYANLIWLYYVLGDYEQAVTLYAKTEGVLDVSARLITLTNVGNAHLYLRDMVAAGRAYEEVLQLVKANKPDNPQSVGYALANLARVKLETGHIDEARAFVGRAIAYETGTKDVEDELIARVVEARIDIAAKQYAKAKTTLERVAAKVEQQVARIEALGQLGRVHAALNENALAAKSFNAAVKLVRDARTSVKDDNLRITLFNTAGELFDDYIDFLVATGSTEDALRVSEISRAQTLAEGLAVAPTKTLDAKAIAKARNATILCYWVGHRTSYLWTVTDKAIRLSPLPPEDEIKRRVARYSAEIRSLRGTLVVSGDRGAELFDILVKPAQVPANARVIVVPDRILHTINFETLVVPGPQRRYWIKDVVLTNASSLQLLARSGARKPATGMLVVGDPRSGDPAYPPLAQAPAEIASILKHFSGATKLVGLAATPSAYLGSKPERFEFVHFVAHGAASRIRPLDSAVILGPDPKRGQRLLAREIAKHPLAAKLVTISSCEGAGSATYAGEGLVGLAWAFRRAGAQQVIAALWDVADNSAPELMDLMYAGIRQGREPADALRQAKLSLLDSTSAFKQPRHWAPFVIYQ